MNPNKYGLTGKMKAKPEASKLVSTAKGLHLYIVSTDAADSDVVHVTEVWDSKADHDNSLQLPGVKELISQAMPLIDSKPEGAVLEVLGGKGLG